MTKKLGADSVGQYLRERREAKGLTQKDLADHLGLTSPQYISNCERGLCLPSLRALVKLKPKLGLDIEKTINLYVSQTEGRLQKALGNKAKKRA